jgi:PAS domain S-box-containing protein
LNLPPKSEMSIARRIGWILVACSLCFFLLPALGLGAGPAPAQTQVQVDLSGKNVLVIHSGETNGPLFQSTDKGLSTTLGFGGFSGPKLFFESLSLIRTPGAEYRKALAEKFRLQYGHRKVDVIITMYPEALAFLLKDCGDIFPDVPTIALYLQKNVDLSTADRTIVGHTASLDITGTLEIALSLVPGVKRVYVVSGKHEVDRRIEAQARRDLKKWETRLEFQYLSHMPFEEMLATVSNVPPGSILLLLALVQDIKGAKYTTPIVAQRLSQVSAAPIFGVVDTGLGYGIVGGSLLDSERIGSQAGKLVLDFLSGIAPRRDASEILKTPPVPIFDWRQLKRWHLSESALPKGSIISNKEFTIWDFKYHMIGILAFCLAESVLIIFLVGQIRRKKSAETSLREAEKKYRNIFEGAVEGIFETSPQGKPLTVNPTLARILGYDSSGEFMSKIQDLGRQLYSDPDKRLELLRLMEKQDVVLGFELEIMRRDGVKIWASVSSRRVVGSGGETLYYSGFVQDITERKQAEKTLEDLLRFERLVSNISAGLVNISPDQLDPEIEDKLKQILEFFQSDRCALLQVLPDKTEWKITHVSEQEILPPVPRGIKLPVSINPWAYDKLIRRHEVLSVSRLDDLPAEADVDKQTWIKWGIRSNLNIPIIIGGSVDHIIVFNSVKSERDWPEEFIPRLRLLGEILVNALERKQTEETSRKRDWLLRQSEKDLRQLAGRLIFNQELERSRLARELHDDLVQRLAVFAIDIGKLEGQLPTLPALVREKLRVIKEGLVKTSGDVHNLSRQLHPSILDDLGLTKAVESECTNFSRREGINVVFNHENIRTDIPKDICLSLYRIIQEGLNNISKHACAGDVSVSLQGKAHDVLLSVQDNGIGFDPVEVKYKPGLGLSSIRERVRLINGELAIHSQPEKGTLISVRVPLKL